MLQPKSSLLRRKNTLLLCYAEKNTIPTLLRRNPDVMLKQRWVDVSPLKAFICSSLSALPMAETTANLEDRRQVYSCHCPDIRMYTTTDLEILVTLSLASGGPPLTLTEFKTQASEAARQMLAELLKDAQTVPAEVHYRDVIDHWGAEAKTFEVTQGAITIKVRLRPIGHLEAEERFQVFQDYDSLRYYLHQSRRYCQYQQEQVKILFEQGVLDAIRESYLMDACGQTAYLPRVHLRPPGVVKLQF